MPRFGRNATTSRFRRNPQSPFKMLAAFLVIAIFLIIKEFTGWPVVHTSKRPSRGAHIQYADWKNQTGRSDQARAPRIRDGMKYMFWKYREHAWGYDDIKPVSGRHQNTRNGWGAFIVDSSTTLALMGLWDELELAVGHILALDFTTAEGLVDPFETTIRYLGALVSLVELADVGIIPTSIVDDEVRDSILLQAKTLADSLGPAYDTPSGLPWPRVDFALRKGRSDPPHISQSRAPTQPGGDPSIGPARAGSNMLENRVLTRLTGDPIYAANATKAWSTMVWTTYRTPWPGLVDMPLDVKTGAPVGRRRSWDAAHDSYYEYLIKIALLSPPSDLYLSTYEQRFRDAAYSLRSHLASRSAPSDKHWSQHLFIGTQNGDWATGSDWYENRQSHLACFAPAALLLGAKYLDQPYLLTFGKALLEGCRYTYTSTATGLGPEKWAWIPKFGYDDPTFQPQTFQHESQLNQLGYWMVDRSYNLRPEYIESVFYAYRITGEERYREWAWEAWEAIERECKVEYGFAGLKDVDSKRGSASDGPRWIDEQESFFGAETLKYLWLIFQDADFVSLDSWVFNTEAHPFRMIR